MRSHRKAKNHRLVVKNVGLEFQPFWGYEDIGTFLLLAILLGLVLRFLIRCQFLSRFAITNRSVAFQFVVIALLGAGLYFILRFRYHRPVLKPLGWVVPRLPYIVTAVILGPSFAAGIALCLQLRNPVTTPIPISELLILGLVFGPILEESFFRGCLLPVLALSTGTIPAVVISGVVFAAFHGPTDVAHWVALTATGIAYGWMRVASRSTTAPALMHAAYNLTLFLLAVAWHSPEHQSCSVWHEVSTCVQRLYFHTHLTIALSDASQSLPSVARADRRLLAQPIRELLRIKTDSASNTK